MKSPLLQKKSKPVEKDVSYKSTMIGMPGSATRKKVEKDMKGKKVDSPAKMVREKATGETYSSKSAMKKHEKGESKAEMKKEYGKPKSPIKQTMSKGTTSTPRPTGPTKGVKEAPVKMKKC
jgi:hypothetical protein